MPIIRVEMLPGRSQEIKQQFMEKLTQLTCETLNCPVEAVDIIFSEPEPSSWAHAGKFYGQPAKASNP